MLRGKNVILRAIERDDLKHLHALYREVDLVLLTYDSWQPEPLAQFERDFDKYLDEQDKSRFVIEVDEKVIGGISLHTKNRLAGTAALGVAIYDREYLGGGYGRDAISVLLDWAFRIQNYRRIWLDVLATNERAIRSYRACGFVEEGRLRQHTYYNGDFVDSVVMGLLRSEWEVRNTKANDTTM